MLQSKLLEFINALLVLFEDKNKILYKRLILAHHQIKNVLDENEINQLLTKYFKPVHVEMIRNRNTRFLDNTPLSIDIALLFEYCTSENKTIIWKWIDVILSTYIDN
jgi:hypothetical protein